jgi:MFS family permease
MESSAVTISTRAAAPPTADQGRRSATLAVGSAATLLVLMNYSAPAITLPQIAVALRAGPIGQVWILNGIALGLAALLLTTGTLADDHGRKRVFVIGSVTLMVASAACAMATGTLAFVLARIVQGGASAALLTTSLGMIGHAFPNGPARVRATATWGAMIGAGLTVGPPIAAVLAERVSWRAVYWIVAAVTAVIIIAAVALLVESRAAVRRRVDVPGVATLGLGLAALLGGVTQGRTGWGAPPVLIMLAAGAVLLGAFVAVEARGSSPMLDLSLLRRPRFLVSVSGALVTGLSVIGPLTYLATILQVVDGFSPTEAAGAMAIWTSASVVSSLAGGRLRTPARIQLAVGLALGAVGDLALLGAVGHWSGPRDATALVIIGIGSGLSNAALARLSVESVPHDRASMGSGANNTARYIGGSLGVAMAVAIVGAGGTPAAGTNAMIWTAVGISVLGGVLAVILRD